MLAIVACISFNVLLAVIFRWFKVYRVDNLLAITTNYFIAAGVASLYANRLPWNAMATTEPWMIPGLILGLLFIIGFSTVAATIQHFGIGLTAVFQKVSLVLTAIFAMAYFREAAGWQKLIGVPLAIIAIYLINHKDEKLKKKRALTWLILSLPLLTFIFNGLIDTYLFYLEKTELVAAGNFQFISTIFLTAGVFGSVLVIFQLLFDQKKIEMRSIIGGIVLGIPNFYSIRFFLLALGSGFDGSMVVPINNAGIILVSALIGNFFFREQFSRINIFGIFLALLSILFLSLQS